MPGQCPLSRKTYACFLGFWTGDFSHSIERFVRMIGMRSKKCNKALLSELVWRVKICLTEHPVSYLIFPAFRSQFLLLLLFLSSSCFGILLVLRLQAQQFLQGFRLCWCCNIAYRIILYKARSITLTLESFLKPHSSVTNKPLGHESSPLSLRCNFRKCKRMNKRYSKTWRQSFACTVPWLRYFKRKVPIHTGDWWGYYLQISIQRDGQDTHLVCRESSAWIYALEYRLYIDNFSFHSYLTSQKYTTCNFKILMITANKNRIMVTHNKSRICNLHFQALNDCTRFVTPGKIGTSPEFASSAEKSCRVSCQWEGATS